MLLLMHVREKFAQEEGCKFGKHADGGVVGRSEQGGHVDGGEGD